MKNKYEMIVLDDKFGHINSHWAYSTSRLNIIERVYYDEHGFEKKMLDLLRKFQVDLLGISGRGAGEALEKLNNYLLKNSFNEFLKFSNILKIAKLHNTNLNRKKMKKNLKDRNKLMKNGNDWVKIALKYPFDILMVQTYGDDKILNDVLKKDVAYWVPYLYNDKIFTYKDVEKQIDIGAYFKVERHKHREKFIKVIEEYAKKRGYTFEFSDKYWGKDYAEKIQNSKVVVHLSYCGDIPWRLYECSACGTCLLTDPLKFGVDKLFKKNKDYIEFNRDLSDLENKLDKVLENEKYRNEIIEHSRKSVKKFTWELGVNKIIIPLIEKKYKEKNYFKGEKDEICSSRKSCEKTS